MHLVDQAGAQVLLDGRHAAAEPDILALGRLPRALERDLDARGDEMEVRCPHHRERGARVMRRHEHRRVVGRFVAPPTLPVVVRPRTSHRTEHVAPENPGADVGEPLLRKLVVDTRLSLALPYILRLVRVGRTHSINSRPPTPSGFCESLARARAVSVDGDREALYAQFRHFDPPAALHPCARQARHRAGSFRALRP